MRYLLDTDTCIEIVRGREPVNARVRAESPEDLAISAMTLAELEYGALLSKDPARTLAKVEAFLSAPIAVVPLDVGAAREHAAIRSALRATPIGERDLVIAATARSLGLIVVTHNRKHLDRVSDLTVEDWTES